MPGRMMGAPPSGPARRFESRDLVALNRWLCVTRLRAAIAVTLFTLVAVHFGFDLRNPAAALGICAALGAASLVGWALPLAVQESMAMVIGQIVVDTVLATLGLQLATGGLTSLLLRPIFMMIIVPSALVSVRTGYFAAALASVGHLLLLGLDQGASTATFVSLASFAPIFLFVLVARQAFFYGAHLEAKNTALAELATKLHGSEQRLEAEGRLLAAIAETARTLNATLEAPEPLTNVCCTIAERLGASWAAIFLVGAEDRFRLGGVTDPDVDLGALERIDFPCSGWPALAQLTDDRPLVLEGDAAAQTPAPFTAGRRLATLVLTGLRRDGELVGFLGVGWAGSAGGALDWAVHLLTGIAAHATVVVQNARLLEEVRVASALKSEFVGAVSHELRSPLNVILGYLEMLLDRELGPLSAEQRAALGRTQAQAVTLLEMIAALLDLNRFEAGRLPIQRTRVDVGTLLDELVAELPESWQRPTVVLRTVVTPGMAPLATDRGKLKTIVRNLVHNALKFTDRGEVVVEAAPATDGATVLTVSDTGRGIAAEAIPYVFDMFRQAPGSEGGGVGLGLHIVRRFVEALGGSVTLTSEVGRGTRFTVALPGATPAARAA